MLYKRKQELVRNMLFYLLEQHISNKFLFCIRMLYADLKSEKLFLLQKGIVISFLTMFQSMHQ